MMFCCEVVDINFDDISTASAYIHTDITIIIIIIIIIYGIYIYVCLCASIYTYTIIYSWVNGRTKAIQELS